MTTKQKRQDEVEAIGAANRKLLAEIIKACGDQSLAVKFFTEGKSLAQVKAYMANLSGEFMAMVDEHQAKRKCTRRDAMSAAIKANPELYQLYRKSLAKS